MSEGAGKNTAIIVAMITLIGSVLTAGIANWDKLAPYFFSPDAPPNTGNNGGIAGDGNPTPLQGTVTELDFSGIASRSYRIGPATVKNIRFDPMPPAVLAQHQEVKTHFSYDVCCGHTARIWVRPVWNGAQCSYGASGSPDYSGTGNGTSKFSMRGANCQSAEITGIRFSVKNKANGNEAKTIIPVQYTFNN